MLACLKVISAVGGCGTRADALRQSSPFSSRVITFLTALPRRVRLRKTHPAALLRANLTRQILYSTLKIWHRKENTLSSRVQMVFSLIRVRWYFSFSVNLAHKLSAPHGLAHKVPTLSESAKQGLFPKFAKMGNT